MAATTAASTIPATTNNALKYMSSIFDPKGDLPVLDIGQRAGETGYFEFIQASEMTYPLMKGQDLFGRHFFCMKAHGQVQTFFQRFMQFHGCWADSGSLVQFTDYLIDGNIINQKAMEKVVAFVTKLRSASAVQTK